jgi:PAS domain-containing protein
MQRWLFTGWMKAVLLNGLTKNPVLYSGCHTSTKMLLDSLKESEHRYRELFAGLPTAVYTSDIDGFIDSYNNPAAVELWGREPQPGKDLWCGFWKIFHPDGAPLLIDECPMALALKGAEKNYEHEIVIERPDGSRRNVLSYSQHMYNAAGKMVGAVNMLVYVTSLKMA